MQRLALLTAERLLPERRLDLVLLRVKASSGFSDGGRDPRALRGRLEFGCRLMARPPADDQSAGLARAPRQSDTRQVWVPMTPRLVIPPAAPILFRSSVTRGPLAMMIPAASPGTNSTDAAADESEQPTSDASDWPLGARPLAYADFSAALKGALRDFHSTDLLARNPLLLGGIRDLSGSVGPMELKALLSETVRTLFDHPRDEKLRRVIELTYFQPAPKQEVVAGRLSLSFGTYRRHLTTARDRLTRWLWESSRDAPTQPEVPAALWPTPKPEKSEGESAASPEAREPAPPRLSVVILPFLNIGGDAQDDHFADGITETLTTHRPLALSRCISDLPQHRVRLQRQADRHPPDRSRARRAICSRGQRAKRRGTDAVQCPARRCRERGASVGRALRQRARRPSRHAGRGHHPAGPYYPHRADRGGEPAGGARASRPPRLHRSHPPRLGRVEPTSVAGGGTEIPSFFRGSAPAR